MEYIIETKGLTKRYRNKTALCQADIKIKKGEIYGLVGANGAGKTTFLKMVAGQIFPDEGELILFGAGSQREQEEQRKRMGALIEIPSFYSELSVEQNMEYYRLQKGIPGKQSVENILKIVDLWEVRKKKGKELSLGMKQRLGIAIALLGEPELLLLDEPTNGMDVTGIIEMRKFLKRLNYEKNITLVISSHLLGELEQLATMYGFLENGNLLQQISAKTLYEKCGKYLEISVSDAEKYTMLLEKKLQHTKYQVLGNGTIQIWDVQDNVEIYSALAGENGIGISAMGMKQNRLEDYYMNLRKEGIANA